MRMAVPQGSHRPLRLTTTQGPQGPVLLHFPQFLCIFSSWEVLTRPVLRRVSLPLPPGISHHQSLCGPVPLSTLSGPGLSLAKCHSFQLAS